IVEAVAETALIAPERAITVGVVSRLVPAAATTTMLRLPLMMLHDRLRQIFVEHVIASIVVAEVLAFARIIWTAQALAAVAIRHLAALLLHLLAIGHD